MCTAQVTNWPWRSLRTYDVVSDQCWINELLCDKRRANRVLVACENAIDRKITRRQYDAGEHNKPASGFRKYFA